MSFIEKMNEWVRRYYGWLLAGATVLAVLLRFVQLGAAGLSSHEAEGALQALSIVKEQQTIVGGEPGYIGLTSILFFLFGGSDFLARFWPALFGSALTLLPGLFRKHLDDLPGVLLAFLIALEPGLVMLSRTADGTMIMVFSLLAAAGFFLTKKMVLAGIFGGLALASSQQFWPLAFILFFAGFLTYIAGRQTSEIESEPETDEKPKWWLLFLSALITILVVSSQFFLYPGGISGIGSGLVGFFDSWRQTGELSLGTFLMVQLVAQFPAILLGVWGLVVGLREKKPMFRFLGLWWIIGLILWVTNPSLGAQHIPIINLPVYVLACIQVIRFVEGTVIRSKIVAAAEALVSVSLILFSTLNFVNLINMTMADPVTQRNRIVGTLLPLVLWIIFSMLLAWGWDVVSTKGGLLIGIGFLFTALLVGSAWKAADLGSRPENELLSGMEYVSGEEELLQTVSDISRWNTGHANRIDVTVAGLNLPSIAWALKDFEKTSTDLTFYEKTEASIILASPDSIVQSPAAYRGNLLVWSKRPAYSQFTWQDWFKWFFNRKIPQQKETIMLWVRNDLFKDVSSQN